MKKIICLLCVCLTIGSFTACENGNTVTTAVTTATETTTETAAETTATAKKGGKTAKKTTKATNTTKTSQTTTCQHTYKEFVCSICGQVDKIHIEGYLKHWLSTHGKISGEHISYSWLNPSTDVYYGITCDISEDILYVSSIQNIANGELFSMVFLPVKNGIAQVCTTFKGYESFEMHGTINATSFTKNSPLACNYYDGNANSRSDYMEMSRIAIIDTVQYLKTCVTNDIDGITMRDLGFNKF